VRYRRLVSSNPAFDPGFDPVFDLGVAYGLARRRITELLNDVDHSDVDGRDIPACPAWTLHDLVAHLTGIADDGTSGNMAGAPGDAWTAAQVARGRSRTIDEMLTRWSETGPLMEGFLSSPTAALAAPAVLDIHTHEQDLRHALHRPAAPPTEFLAWALRYLFDDLPAQFVAAGLPYATVDAEPYELFRARFGRRTAAEVSSYRWRDVDDNPIDPSPYLDTFFIFGRATSSLGEAGGDVVGGRP
jgi:uncharacterized protein (TIGR03083 family)